MPKCRCRDRPPDGPREGELGLGERVHLGTPETNLDTHIADVVNLIETEELRDVVLVGHSYAGSVVESVADRIGERLALVVYVDTAPLEDGESNLDFSPPEEQEATRRRVAEGGDGWLMAPPPFERMAGVPMLAGLSAEDRAQLESIARSQSLPAALSRRADGFAPGGWRDEQRRCAPVPSQSSHGLAVAKAFCRTRHQWAAQRAQARPTAQYRRG